MCENGAHAARTDPNGPIPPATYDLGTLGGTYSWANDINDVGQAVGHSVTPGDTSVHAFRTAPNMPINPATDDLGPDIQAISIDDFGQVIGSSFGLGLWLYSNGGWHDLNNDNLVPAASTCYGFAAVDINNVGQIAANASCSGQQHAVRLDPIYKGFVQQPINADGSSVFKANRGVIPVKFAVTQYNSPSCALPATIGITRISGGTLGAVDQSTYSTQADNGSNFRIDGCQYIYNLAASSLGVGTYRVDISINGIFVGHAVFALE
jgi:probable HAF family extracellular repeat protein